MMEVPPVHYAAERLKAERLREGKVMRGRPGEPQSGPDWF